MGKTYFSGSGGIFVSASRMTGYVGTFTLTRNAAGNYSLNLTAAANSPFVEVPLDRGLTLTSFDVIYSIATAALTTHTAALYRAKYTTGAAVAMTTEQAAAAIGTATTTNLRVSNIKVASPYDVGVTTDAADMLEIAIVNPGTAVYVLYGVMLYGNKIE